MTVAYDPALPSDCYTIQTHVTLNYTAISTGVSDGNPLWDDQQNSVTFTTRRSPILSPPSELLSLDPDWSTHCENWFTKGEEGRECEIPLE